MGPALTNNRTETMNANPNINMIEATRLTREGRLAEAMALLQGMPPSAHPSPAAGDNDKDAGTRPEGLAARIIDMVPPSFAGGAWTPPKFTFRNPAPNAFNGPAAGLNQSQVPEALRGFLDRISQPGSALGLDGLVGPGPTRAPSPLPEGARFEVRTFANEAGSRAY